MLKLVAFRHVLAMVAAAAIVAWLGMPYFDGLLSAWSRVTAESRARKVMNAIESPLSNMIDANDRESIRDYLKNLQLEDSRVAAVVLCGADGSTIARSSDSSSIACKGDGEPGETNSNWLVQDASGSLLASRFRVHLPGHTAFRAIILRRMLAAGSDQTIWRKFAFAFISVTALVLALLVALLAWWLLRRWVALLISDIRGGRFFEDAWSPRFSQPILSQVRKVLREVEETQRREIDYRENWTPQALQQVVKEQLQSEQIIVVSNRQPYSHMRDADNQLRVQLPASGMVTALEPIMRACSGVWVAHGSGSADREVVDRNDRIRVPPEAPVYTLRRVWLSKEEEAAYYYGFSNEGLWPLCHLAYVRPAFRQSDWQTYRAVNQRFADAVASTAESRSPVVLIQDFHFSLLPLMVRERIPQATIALFWHVPWPNAETFGVCPWKRDILLHMLRADILGFHTLYHCQNFLATADRFIECQINQEHMTVTLRGHTCHVAPYPISIEWPPRWLAAEPDIATARREVRSTYGIGENVHLALGVERWDFTKGIVERFQALEVYLEQQPAARGSVTLLQIAAPSRSELPAYRELQQRTLAEAARVNGRFATDTWKPIVLVGEHQEPESVFRLYRAADVCVVNSLHDGMNLVAKEFIAARDDEDGVLILSTFAGASRELVEALLVNPFDVVETASAIGAALAMSRDERRERMRLMRSTVQDNNVYRWAGRMLTDAARIRQRQSLRIGAPQAS